MIYRQFIMTSDSYIMTCQYDILMIYWISNEYIWSFNISLIYHIDMSWNFDPGLVIGFILSGKNFRVSHISKNGQKNQWKR